MTGRAIVIIPTYNESENIEQLIIRLRALYPRIDIMVVDDNSPDGTAAIVRRLAGKNRGIRLITRPGKSGLGRAYVEGFRAVLNLDHAYELVVEMDADLSHDPSQLAALLSAAGRADCVIGSRYIRGGAIANWSWHRRAISSLGNFYTRFLLGNSVRDWTSGYRVFKKRVLENIALDSIGSKGYLFQIEVLDRCVRKGYTVTEVPIRFCDRRKGNTKLGLREIWEALWGVARMRLRHAQRWNRPARSPKDDYARF